jgi:hypothetical protein
MELLTSAAQSMQRFAVGWLCVLACLPMEPTAAQGTPYSEESIKAAYLYRFAGYIEWPHESSDAGAAETKPFTIAVLGAAGVADHLDRILPTLQIKNRPARVRQITSLSELRDASILYIRAGSSNRVKKLIESIARKPVLIVTDDSSGLEMGGMINFREVDHRVRFEVSLVTAQRAKFRISSELLALALRVEGTESQPAGGTGCQAGGVVAPCRQGGVQR